MDLNQLSIFQLENHKDELHKRLGEIYALPREVEIQLIRKNLNEIQAVIDKKEAINYDNGESSEEEDVFDLKPEEKYKKGFCNCANCKKQCRLKDTIALYKQRDPRDDDGYWVHFCSDYCKKEYRINS